MLRSNMKLKENYKLTFNQSTKSEYWCFDQINSNRWNSYILVIHHDGISNSDVFVAGIVGGSSEYQGCYFLPLTTIPARITIQNNTVKGEPLKIYAHSTVKYSLIPCDYVSLIHTPKIWLEKKT